jgi:hypothetical protein
MMKVFRSPMLASAIAFFALCDAALVIVAAEYRPATWQRQPRLTFVDDLRTSRDTLAGNVDGVFYEGKQLMPGSARRVTIQTRGGFEIRGWAYDATQRQPFSAMLMSVDRGAEAPVAYGSARPDVATVMKCDRCVDTGFRIAFVAGEMHPGVHTIHFRYLVAGQDAVVDSEPLILDVR